MSGVKDTLEKVLPFHVQSLIVLPIIIYLNDSYLFIYNIHI